MFKTSAKDGKKVKIAISRLVKEILKDSSFLNLAGNTKNKNGDSS